MDNFKTNPLSSKIQSLLDSHVQFPQKLKQHFVFKSDQVSNPFKFIEGLLSKGVLCDEANDSKADFGLKEMMVRLAMMIACTKGAEGIGGLMEALEESGNSQLLSDFRAWIKEDFDATIESIFGQPEGAGSSAPTKKPEVSAAQAREVNDLRSWGAKLVDKIVSRMDDDLMEQLQGHFIGRANEIVNTTEFRSSLVNLKVLDEKDVPLATGPENKTEQWTENFIKAACSKKAIGSLVVAFQKSNNERILIGASEWLETSYLRKKNYPISVKCLAREPRPTATGIFAATSEGLISLDLRTVEATSLTSGQAIAVAVNHNLRKVYWSEGYHKSHISRSNFDGSAKEMIVPQTGYPIWALAIDESSGNVYFALRGSHEIKFCNAVGENCAVVISDSSLVDDPIDIALDSANGFMYWGNGGSGSVVRANLDGSSCTVISTEFKSLSGITLDGPSTGILYWADAGARTIGTIDVNDRKKRIIVELETYSGLWGIQVDNGKIYLGTCASKAIRSFDKNSGKGLATIFGSTGYVRHLALFNAPHTETLDFSVNSRNACRPT